jgi:hypothetical protein
MPSVGIDRSYAWLLPACLWLWAAHAANQTLPRCSQAKRGKIKQGRWRNSIRNGRRETRKRSTYDGDSYRQQAHAGCELGHDTQQIDDAPARTWWFHFTFTSLLACMRLLLSPPIFRSSPGFGISVWTGSEAPTHTHSRGLVDRFFLPLLLFLFFRTHPATSSSHVPSSVPNYRLWCRIFYVRCSSAFSAIT